MTDIWLTVPTAGRATLRPMIEGCGIPPERIVVVTTAPDVDVPLGCHAVPDLGEINIHRWWNRGIDFAVKRGARYVAVVNDDIHITPETLPLVVAAMRKHGATLGSPGDEIYMTNPNRDLPMTILGACWVLDTTHGLRPDEGYRWWYGDNEIDHQARAHYHGIARVPAPYQHLTPNQLTANSGELTRLTELDQRRWAANP